MGPPFSTYILNSSATSATIETFFIHHLGFSLWHIPNTSTIATRKTPKRTEPKLSLSQLPAETRLQGKHLQHTVPAQGYSYLEFLAQGKYRHPSQLVSPILKLCFQIKLMVQLFWAVWSSTISETHFLCSCY